LGLSDPNVREVGRLMGPRVVGLAVVQVNFWVNTLLASRLSVGSISSLNYAWLLMLLPQGIVAQAAATAAFPTFAALEARGRYVELRHTVSSTLRGVLFLTIPAAVGLFVWRVPLIRMLLERGEFTARSTQMTAAALAFFAFGLIGHSVVEIVARAFYALHDTRTPVAVGVGAMALNVLLSVLLIQPLQHAGLALANTLATSIEMALLLGLLVRRLGGLEWPQLSATILRAGVATLVMVLPLSWAAMRWSGDSPVLVGVAGLVIGAALYLAAAVFLRMPEVQVIWQLGARR
jgi:putative peptidoglycan lipid II flippase